MTVCVATLCEDGVIFGAADRMLTVEEQAIQFEPRYTKIWHVAGKRIALMTAGDAAFNAELIGHISTATAAPNPSHPAEMWRVQDVVRLYQAFFREQKQERAEARLLSPLGLTPESFVERQQQLLPRIAEQITSEMIDFRMPSVSAIVAGSDDTGSHLWVVEGQDAFCCDIVGFAAIGVGAPHANSQLMMARHSPIIPGPEGVLLTYLAKRRSEIAPGVGAGTDMFFVQRGAEVTIVNDYDLARLENYYLALVDAEGKALSTAIEEVKKWMTPTPPTDVKLQPESQSPSEQPPPPASTDGP